jgi:hypothetical protein
MEYHGKANWNIFQTFFWQDLAYHMLDWSSPDGIYCRHDKREKKQHLRVRCELRVKRRALLRRS